MSTGDLNDVIDMEQEEPAERNFDGEVIARFIVCSGCTHTYRAHCTATCGSKVFFLMKATKENQWYFFYRKAFISRKN